MTPVRRLALGLLASLAAAGPAAAAESVGVLTELHLGDGRVEVRPAAGGDWQPAGPLLAVHPGDQLRATGGARAVVVLAASQRSALVTRDNSPFVAPSPSQSGLSERVKSALGFLQSTPREPSRVSAAVRSSGHAAPLIVAPRDTRVFPDGVTLDFTGPDHVRYAVRILSADDRVLWARGDLPPRPLALPARDVRLAPGRYRWELQAAGQAPIHAAFEVASPEQAERVRAAAADVTAAQYPPATAALLRAAGLMRERFYADARAELLAGIATSPDEPTLHLLLAHLYQETGLEELAEREYGEARGGPAR